MHVFLKVGAQSCLSEPEAHWQHGSGDCSEALLAAASNEQQTLPLAPNAKGSMPEGQSGVWHYPEVG